MRQRVPSFFQQQFLGREIPIVQNTSHHQDKSDGQPVDKEIARIEMQTLYAAFHPPVRDSAMVFGATEKITLGIGVLATSLRRHTVAATIAAGDSFIVLIYIGYLAGF